MKAKRFGFLLHGLLALSLVILAGASPAHAEGGRRYGMAGCGLGSIVFQGHNSPIAQIFAYTTDGTLLNQSFGITTGTSNCTEDGVATLDKEQELFAEANFENLASDMAKGEGEYLASFSTLMGCRADLQGHFAQTTQSRYGEIFSREDATASDVVRSVSNILRSDTELSQGCSRI